MMDSSEEVIILLFLCNRNAVGPWSLSFGDFSPPADHVGLLLEAQSLTETFRRHFFGFSALLSPVASVLFVSSVERCCFLSQQ